MEKKVRGEDLDGSPAVHVIQYKVATFNESLFSQLRNFFSQIHQLIFRPVWLSLYEQTFFELEVSRYVNEFATKNSAESGKKLFGVLCENFAENKKNMSPHGAAVMRGVILFVGAILLGIAEGKKESNDDRLCVIFFG